MIRWITQKEANQFVIDHHRHHGKVVGSIFQLGLFEHHVTDIDGDMVTMKERLDAVAICGRPVARKIDYRRVLEVTRLCSNGQPNACSQLYSACCRIAKEMGFEKVITYILESESGTSLKASGWNIEESNVGGLNWSVPSRKRETETINLFGTITKYPSEMKVRWAKVF